MKSLVDVRLGNRGVRTEVRVSEHGGRDAEGVDEQVGRGGWGGHWHCATERGTQDQIFGLRRPIAMDIL